MPNWQEIGNLIMETFGDFVSSPEAEVAEQPLAPPEPRPYDGIEQMEMQPQGAIGRFFRSFFASDKDLPSYNENPYSMFGAGSRMMQEQEKRNQILKEIE